MVHFLLACLVHLQSNDTPVPKVDPIGATDRGTVAPAGGAQISPNQHRRWMRLPRVQLRWNPWKAGPCAPAR